MATFTQDAAASPANIRSNSSVQECALGTKVVTPDGRAFRYVKCGSTALVPGKLYDGQVVGSNYNIAVAAEAAIGATQVTVTLGTTVTANQLAGGTLIVNDVTGQGYTYSIKSHPAADAAASCVITLVDEEPLIVALDTTSQVTLIPNQYNGVVIHATTEAGVPVGVAVTAVTANYYGWIQTRGPVSILCNATTGIGEAVSASDTTNAGGVEVGDGILAPVGHALAPGVASEYNAVFLRLD